MKQHDPLENDSWKNNMGLDRWLARIDVAFQGLSEDPVPQHGAGVWE